MCSPSMLCVSAIPVLYCAPPTQSPPPLIHSLLTPSMVISARQVARLSPLLRQGHHHHALYAVRVVPHACPVIQVDTVIPASVVVLVPGQVHATTTRAHQAVAPNKYFVVLRGDSPELTEGGVSKVS